jgi:hypothetical protein
MPILAPPFAPTVPPFAQFRAIRYILKKRKARILAQVSIAQSFAESFTRAPAMIIRHHYILDCHNQIPKVSPRHCGPPRVSHTRPKKNPAVAGSGFSRDNTNWVRGLAPRGVANNQHNVAPQHTRPAN